MNSAIVLVPSEVDAVIHTLEAHVARHGELMNALLIQPEQLRQRWQECQQAQLYQYEGPRFQLEPLSGNEKCCAPIHKTSFAFQAYQYWIEHLQRLAQPPCPPELEAGCMQKICEWIIFSAQQAGLASRLDAKLQHYDHMLAASLTCAAMEVNEFVTWLGYKEISPDLRPRSKANPGRAIFSPLPHDERPLPLTRLGEQPSYRNEAYISDWLIALYARGLEQNTVKAAKE
ncbi:hypothetical protein HWQ17_10945 [Enterobacter pasteurii]|uniref:virulence factor SrfC family protein n=1 Tax=Enterobacter pasteurii TaxID=3029761 RepID=UPI0011DD58DB|nr:virulence factor SrfC family protein [Enterobacter pasteurii]QLA68122.1 hypothetical protein HWQ17_10945 [Enterobacter pasteurii]